MVGDDDGQHDREGIDQDRLLGRANLTSRFQDADVTGRERQRARRDDGQAPRNSQLRPDGMHSNIPAAAVFRISLYIRRWSRVKTSR